MSITKQLRGRARKGSSFCGSVVVWMLGMVVSSSPTRADEALGDQWIPSLGIGVDLQIEHDSEASIRSSLRPEVEGDRDFVSGVPFLDGEILTPEIDLLPSQPRLFAHAAWQWGWRLIEEERSVASEGDAGGELFLPEGRVQRASDVDGQGQRLDQRMKDGWTAGLGLAFSQDLLGYSVRWKPSFDYHGETVELTGLLVNATIPAPNVPPSQVSIQRLEGDSEKTYHGFGPHLAIEVDVARTGPLSVAFFLEGYVYWFPGSRDDRFVASTPDGVAIFEHERAPYVSGAGVGIRFSPSPD